MVVSAASAHTAARMTPAFEDLRYARDRHVATITLSRPERLNAFRAETMRDFLAALDEADGDDEVRAVVVTGDGRAFCAGADISGGARAFEPTAAADTGERAEAPRDGGGILALRIHAMKKPMIAAVNGAAVGMGATMTLPMDVRLASTTARFGFVFTRRGIIPEGCSSWFLPRVVGIGTASEWMLTGRVVDAPVALAAGLVQSVHEPADLLPAAYALAEEIGEHAAPVSAAMTRQLLWHMLSAPSPLVAHEAESRGLASRSRSDDAREGVASFLEKRAPHFPERVSSGYLDLFDE
jgi:enoyl-CoA hydratase/carnithine racemase